MLNQLTIADVVGAWERKRIALAADISAEAASAIDIVVPIYGAFAESLACLHSVAEHTDIPFRLILINDVSPDSRHRELLNELQKFRPWIQIIHHDKNVGFVQSINEGVTVSSDRDVVLLNSDVVVTPRWLGKLMRVARSRSDVATVTPLTNNGTLCSVPDPFRDNPHVIDYGINAFAERVEQLSLKQYPQVPTGVGFCMVVTRYALDRVGLFDHEVFGKGYGEENDFCQRAIKAGLVNLIADDTFVYHKGNASFGAKASAASELAQKHIRRRHPNYPNDVQRCVAEHPLRELHAQLRLDLRERIQFSPERRRVLHLLHYGGGTEHHARDLANTPDPDWVSYVARSNGGAFDVECTYRGNAIDSYLFPFNPPLNRSFQVHHDGYKASLKTMCRALRIDLIHLHHFLENTLDLAEVAHELGIPFCVTLHDYFALCPRYTLVDEKGQLCPACVPDAASEKRSRDTAKPCDAHLNHDHRRPIATFLKSAAACFVPHGAAKAILVAQYPELQTHIEVVEHGHAAVEETGARPSAARYASSRDSLNVAIVGGLNVAKGSGLLQSLFSANRNPRIVFHLYGNNLAEELGRLPLERARRIGQSTVVNHGIYQRSEIVHRLRDDCMDVGLLLSIWPETFCFVLSEYAQAGVPVICGDLGAQAERTRVHQLGWVVDDIADVEQVVLLLDRLCADRAQLLRARELMHMENACRSHQAMWQEYQHRYAEMIRVNSRPVVAESMAEEAYLRELARRALRDHRQIHQQTMLLHSPRHRVATALAAHVQKLPMIWPIVSRVTENVLSAERRRKKRLTKESTQAQ